MTHPTPPYREGEVTTGTGGVKRGIPNLKSIIYALGTYRDA